MTAVTGKRVLITGGTGSFADTAVPRFLDGGAAEIVIFSRDEYKQFNISRRYDGEPRVRFLLGDVRDETRLNDALTGVEIVIHAAAMKQVPSCEENPGEAVLTNAIGSLNVMRACLRAGVERAVNLSADKAAMPGGVYGATKMLSERIFADASLRSRGALRAGSVRYGNVLGSRGSVVEIYAAALHAGRPLTVFDPRMVRLVLTQEQVVDLVLYALEHMVGGEIFVKESPALQIVDLAHAMVKVHGEGEVSVLDGEVRAGEKYEAGFLSASEAERTVLTSDGYYVVRPSWADREAYVKHYAGAEPVPAQELDSSTARMLEVEEIVELLEA